MKHVSAAILVGALVTAACDDAPTSPSDGTRFTLRLSSSAYGAAPAVLVTFSGVRARHASRGWEGVALPGSAAQFTCDLRRLQQSDGEIAAGPLPAGDYSEVRLLVQSATLYLDSPSNMTCAANFQTPSGRSTPMNGVPNDVTLARSFRVDAGSDTTMHIALNAEQSIRATGGGSFSFEPIVTVLSVN
jgi:hypothetical protein